MTDWPASVRPWRVLPSGRCFACWGTSYGNPGLDPLGYVWAHTEEEAKAKGRARWPQRFTDCEPYDGVL